MLTYIADFLPRVRAGLEALDMPVPWTDAVDWDHDSDLGDVLFNRFLPGVARLRELDPVTTEVVRLRGRHAAQLPDCASRGARATRSMRAGPSRCTSRSSRTSTADLLTDRHKAALRYVDALIWTPAAIEPEVAAGVRTHFTEAEAFELTVDVMRNAANKIAVSLAADAPGERHLSTKTGRRYTADGCDYTSMRSPMITVRSRGRPNRSAASAVM